MKPCIKRHDPRPEYVRALIGDVPKRMELAAGLGLDERTLRNYASGFTTMPYAVQYLIEASIGISAVRRARKAAGHPPNWKVDAGFVTREMHEKAVRRKEAGVP